MQKPTIGRIVHYSSNGLRTAAIITKIHTEERVTVAAFPPGWGKPLDAVCEYAEETQPIDPDPNKIRIGHGCWTWPPIVPASELPRMRPEAMGAGLTDDQIRELHNGFLDGTATDAIGRHLCHVALGECCIGNGEGAVSSYRYPTVDERASAKARLASHWNR